MAPASFQLVMQSGPTPGKSYPLDKSEIYIGRDINNDIVISDAEISRKHCRLILQGGGYVIEDLGSTNGSFVNGQRLMGPHPLRPGELMMLGENVGLSYEMIGFDVDATVVGGAPPMADAFSEDAYGAAPAVESYAPQDYDQSQPMNAGQFAPVQQTNNRGGCRRWLMIGCGCLLVVVCLLAILIPLVFLAAPDLLETVICWPVFKSLTNTILDGIGSVYYCP